jgi:hypothetical protein
VGILCVVQAAVKEHYEENESDFNSCPSVNFVNLVRCQQQQHASAVLGLEGS